MDSEWARLILTRVLARRATADKDGVSIGRIIRAAINRHLVRREKAKTPGKADERLVAALAALLADDFGRATCPGSRISKGSNRGHGSAQLLGKTIDQGHEPATDRA